jgi:tape measure domain-containing protein
MADKQISTELSIGVKGRESVAALASDLEDVAKVLDGDMKTAAEAAAQELRELGRQNEAINAFAALERETRLAAQALKTAEKEAANYGAQVGRNVLMTKEEADGLVRLQARVKDTRDAYTQSNKAMQEAQAELTRLGVSAKDTGAAHERLQQRVDAVREAVKGLAPAYRGAASGAAGAGDSMERTHRKISDGVHSISDQLAQAQKLYTAFLGLQGGARMVRNLAETADAFKNLQARIKLVTGEGQAFADAWEGVSEIAQRTSSDLEATGTLFARLTDAGKSAGLATQAAIDQSLALTETINQAVQLSGGSAEYANAAITQLIQGFQSGVLRGDEFNSVMEQSPRLAKALADGLGVTTGELRKMAEAGQLTSETVIAALRSQANVLTDEFSKLPATVGRALQNLSSAWTQYIGESDQATGASARLAGAIDLVARNLDTLIGLLMDAGQAVTAFMALRLAQYFLGIRTAAQSAAVAVGTVGTQLTATGTAASAAAVTAGRFVTVLKGLRTLTLLGLLTNLKDIGTALGEGAAKLMGYKDRSEELARAEKLQAEIAKEAAADRARLAAATQAAIDKQFELSKASGAAVAQFQQLTKEGTSAAEAIKKITEDFDLSKVDGIKDFAATLDKLATDGKISAKEFSDAWAQALSGKDLAQFEVTARAAFAGAAREGERLAQMMDAVLREAVKRTGLEYTQLQGNIGAAARSAINDVEAIVAGLSKLKAEGVDTGRVLVASLTKAIDTADSQAAIDSLTTRIEQMRSTLGDKIADGLLDQAKQKAEALADALDKATPGINSVREAMKTLGIVSDESLKRTAATAKEAYDTLTASGTASARELQEAFKKSAEAAIAANNGVAPAWVTASAAVRGFAVEVDAAGKSSLKLASAVDKAAQSHDRAAASAKTQATELERLNAETERQIAAQEKANDLATRALKLEEAKRNAGTIKDADGVPSFESQEQADAWLAEWKRQYQQKNPFSTNSNGALGSFMYETTMAEWRAELDAMKLRSTMKGNGNASESSQTPLESMRSGTSVIRVELPDGQSYDVDTTTANGRSELERMTRALASMKRRSA